MRVVRLGRSVDQRIEPFSLRIIKTDGSYDVNWKLNALFPMRMEVNAGKSTHHSSVSSLSSERVVHHPNAPSPTRSVFNLGKSTLQILHWMNSPISNRPRGNCHSFHSVYRSQWLPNAHRLQSPRRYSQRRSCIQSGFPSISHKTSNGNNPVEHSRSYLAL